jgi:putative transposase
MSKHRKTWTPDEKLEVLNYRNEHGLAKASREYGVSSESSLNWEKKFLENGNKGLERGSKTAIERELQKALRENRELKAMVAEKDLALRIKDFLLKKSQQRK